MSLALGTQINCNNRWELAVRLSEPKWMPIEVLESIFQPAINQLEVLSKETLKPHIRNKVWNCVSKDRLTTLNETFIQAFKDHIIQRFNDNEVEEMLTQHIDVGSISNSKYRKALQQAIDDTKEKIEKTMDEKATSMISELIPEMFAAFKEQGISIL